MDINQFEEERRASQQKIAHKINPNVVVSSSRAYPYLFSKIRDKNTPSTEFAFYAKRLMTLLAEDAIAQLATDTTTPIDTPCQPYTKPYLIPSTLLPDIVAVSIVRAGDSLLEVVRGLLPGCPVGKILIQRQEHTKEKLPQLLYSKLPPKKSTSEPWVLLCDPMLATGGSAIAALDVLTKPNDNGSTTGFVKPERVVFINVITCPEGLQALKEKYPQVKIVTAWVDDGMNEEKFILPGLGDYGDRFFNTV